MMQLALAAGPTSWRGLPWAEEDDEAIATAIELLDEMYGGDDQ